MVFPKINHGFLSADQQLIKRRLIKVVLHLTGVWFFFTFNLLFAVPFCQMPSYSKMFICKCFGMKQQLTILTIRRLWVALLNDPYLGCSQIFPDFSNDMLKNNFSTMFWCLFFKGKVICFGHSLGNWLLQINKVN